MIIGEPLYTDANYAHMLINLFPQGKLFPRTENTSFWRYCLGMATELFRIDGRANTLISEARAAGADELIVEYERDYGFPDDCFGVPATLEDKRTQLVERETFPSFLNTVEPGHVESGDCTVDSAVISGMGSTASIMVGDLVQVSAGFFGGKYEVTAKTADSITLEEAAIATAAGVSVTPFFNKAECSERFFKAVARWMGFTISAFEYFDDMARAGLVQVDLQSGCVVTQDSNVITDIGDTFKIKVGSYLVVNKGFGVRAHRVVSVGEHSATLGGVIYADNTYADAEIRVFDSRPFGMGDELGMMNQFAVRVWLPMTGTEQLRAYLLKINPAHVRMEFRNDAD